MDARRLHLLEVERVVARQREERERIRQQEWAHEQETRQWQVTQSWPSQWVSQPTAQFSVGPLPSLVDQQPAPLQPCSHGVSVHQHSTAKDQFSTVQEAVAAAAASVAVIASLGSQLPTGTSFVSEPWLHGFDRAEAARPFCLDWITVGNRDPW